MSQLARENKKFLYRVIKDGARAREYEDAVNWLVDAGLIYKLYNVKKPELPLKPYEDLRSFKIYMNDVGLLRRMTRIDSKIIIEEDDLFKCFKGALTENYALNMLKIIYDSNVNYFTFDRNEIDFLLQYKNNIIPVEVKSGTTVNNISLKKYNEKYKPSMSVRFSLRDLKKDGNILNISLYMIEEFYQFL